MEQYCPCAAVWPSDDAKYFPPESFVVQDAVQLVVEDVMPVLVPFDVDGVYVGREPWCFALDCCFQGCAVVFACVECEDDGSLWYVEVLFALEADSEAWWYEAFCKSVWYVLQLGVWFGCRVGVTSDVSAA